MGCDAYLASGELSKGENVLCGGFFGGKLLTGYVGRKYPGGNSPGEVSGRVSGETYCTRVGEMFRFRITSLCM